MSSLSSSQRLQYTMHLRLDSDVKNAWTILHSICLHALDKIIPYLQLAPAPILGSEFRVINSHPTSDEIFCSGGGLDVHHSDPTFD